MKKHLVFSALIVIFVLLVVFVIIPEAFQSDTTYSGQEVFLTVETFEEFKQDLKMRVYEDNLGLDSFDVLASDPPIIVSFEVTVPHDYDLPYGAPFMSRGVHTFLCVLLVIGIAAFLLYLPSYWIYG